MSYFLSHLDKICAYQRYIRSPEMFQIYSSPTGSDSSWVILTKLAGTAIASLALLPYALLRSSCLYLKEKIIELIPKKEHRPLETHDQPEGGKSS